MAVTEADRWAGQELAARRAKRRLTQEKLGELAGLDRPTIVKLENGGRRISLYYAERLAPHLGLKDPRRLLPPAAQPADDGNPLARLAKLEGEVADLRAALTDARLAHDVLRERVEKAEQAAQRRASR